MTATDVAVPPIPPIRGELSAGWMYGLIHSSMRRRRLYGCHIARRVLPFYESRPSSGQLPRAAIVASEQYACTVSKAEQRAVLTFMSVANDKVFQWLYSYTDHTSKSAVDAARCAYHASQNCIYGPHDNLRSDALECLPKLQREAENTVHEHLAVWMLANPRLKPTEQSTGLAQQIIDERRWTVSMAGMLCDALIEAGLKDKHWLPHVLWHPDVVNLPVLGVTFLERLANPKPS